MSRKNIIKTGLIGILFCIMAGATTLKVKAKSMRDIQEQVHSKDDNSDCLTLQDLREDGRPDFNSDFYKNGDVYYSIDKYSGDLYKVQFVPTKNKIKKVESVKNKEGKTVKYKYFKEYKEKAAHSADSLKNMIEFGLWFMLFFSIGMAFVMALF